MPGYDEVLPGREIAVRELNSLRGRLCTVIESLALPVKQEKAIINLIKNLSFQNQATIVELIELLDNGAKREFRYTNSRLTKEPFRAEVNDNEVRRARENIRG